MPIYIHVSAFLGQILHHSICMFYQVNRPHPAQTERARDSCKLRESAADNVSVWHLRLLIPTHTHTVSRGVIGGSTQGPKEGEEQERPSQDRSVLD